MRTLYTTESRVFTGFKDRDKHREEAEVFHRGFLNSRKLENEVCITLK